MALPVESPSAENFYIGKGHWLWAFIDPVTGVRGPWKHMGNIPTAEVTTDDQRLDKFSSMDADARLLATRLQRRTQTLRVALDEWGREQVKSALMGTLDTVDQAATPVADLVLATDVVLGAAYRLPAIKAVTTPVLEKTGTPDVALVEHTDFEWISKPANLFRILETATNIADGDELKASFTPIAITDIPVIAVGKASRILVSLMFVGDPTTGPAMLTEIWKASIAPDGALGLISEEYGQIGLIATLESDSAGQYGGSAAYPVAKQTFLQG